MDEKTAQSLLDASLYTFQPEDWPGWYAGIAELLGHDEANIRAAAVERLTMAALWAEHFLPQSSSRTDEARLARAAWLTEVLDRASSRHPDVTRFFLNELRHKGDEKPFPQVLVPWLRGLLDRTPAGLSRDRVEGAIVLIGGIEPWQGSPLPPMIDHQSDHVRACVAHVLGRTGYGQDEDGSFDDRLITELTASELARPGIAGPYWSATGLTRSDFDGSSFDPVDWMLGIVERRSGPEPKDLPFNGIDFYIHELAAGNPEAIGRLIDAGRPDLVIMAATEIRDAVPAMTPLLRKLADHPDPGVAVPVQIHLARYYGILHPRADPNRIRPLPDWREGVEVFVIRHGESGRYSDQAVIFSDDGTVLDDAAARAVVDEALPPAVRGELARNPMDMPDAEPAPYQLGRDQLRSYASGANVTLIGALGGPGWRRIEISPGCLKPFGEIWERGDNG